MFINAAFLEIDSGALDNICDDLRVDVSDLSVRHLDGIACGLMERSKGSRECRRQVTTRLLWHRIPRLMGFSITSRISPRIAYHLRNGNRNTEVVDRDMEEVATGGR